MRGFIKNLEPLDLFSLILKLSSRTYFSFEREVIHRADRIIAISRTCAEEIQTFYGIDNAVVITNGVDTNFFSPAKNENQSRYVLYAGAFTTEKGLPDLIRAATYVCQDYPDIKFILAGRGPMERNLKSLVHKLNLDDFFSFVGYVDQHQLRQYYQQAAVFVLPSYHEGLPTVLLEAMSCGIPSVATNVAGNYEVVVDGETGFLAPPKNPQKLAEAILTLLGDEKLRKTMGANARKRAEQHYHWDIITNQIEEIYTSLVS
jgi:glycosyltransferase involved in cell wall biosynthesis